MEGERRILVRGERCPAWSEHHIREEKKKRGGTCGGEKGVGEEGRRTLYSHPNEGRSQGRERRSGRKITESERDQNGGEG